MAAPRRTYFDFDFPAGAHQPKSTQEVCDLLKSSGKQAVRVVGSGHSNTGCLDISQGTLLIYTDNLKDIAIEAGGKRVRCGAGVTVYELAEHLGKAGLQLYMNVEIGNLTIGCAACAGTKDSAYPGEFGIFSSYAEEVTVVDADGRRHDVGERSHLVDGVEAWGGGRSAAALLKHIRSSYGLLGVVTEVTLAVRPLVGLAVEHHAIAGAGRVAEFVRERRAQASIFMYFSPYLDRYVVELRRRTSEPPSRLNWVWSVRNILWSVIGPVAMKVGSWLPSCLMKLFFYLLYLVIEAMGVCFLWSKNSDPARQISLYRDDACCKFQFCFQSFPLEQLEDVFGETSAFCLKYQAETGYTNPLFLCYISDQDQSSTFSYSYDGPIMTVDPVATFPNAEATKFFSALNSHLNEKFKAVLLFNQSEGNAPRTMGVSVRQNPGTPDFLALRRAWDPANRFVNSFYEEVLQGLEGKTAESIETGQGKFFGACF